MDQQSNSNNLDIPKGMGLFTADRLFSDSPFYGEVLKLRDNLSRNSDGNIIDYDAAVQRLRDEVAELPTLELQTSVPSGTESAYQRQLLHALEKINDDHDRVLHKLFKVKSRLANAVTLMKIQRGQFVAFFSLAFPIAIHELSIPDFKKLSVKAIEKIAEGEYSRVMDSLDMAAPSTISEIDILEREIKRRKAAQADKYQMGKDQVNLMWHSIQSNSAIGLDDEPSTLLKRFSIDEEDEDEVPSFVSRHTKEVRFGASIKRPELDPKPDMGVLEGLEGRTLTGTLCSKCKKPQFSTFSGDTCPNGHGGAEPWVDDSEFSSEIKGTFFKRGDPKLVTAVVDDDGEIFVASDADGSAAIAEVACKMNQETVAEIAAKVNKQTLAVPWVVDLIEPTKSVLIEDVEDSPPSSRQEALKLMEEATLGELETTDFKSPTGRVLAFPVVPIGVKLVDNIEEFLNNPELLATPSPVNPRKKLMLMDEEEL